jgi:hypothetical protein
MKSLCDDSQNDDSLSDNLEIFIAYTLIDVTNSGITSISFSETKEYNQAQNLNIFLQSISLRTQPILINVTKKLDQDLTNYKFGSEYKGNHTVWVIEFATEYFGAWEKDNNNLYYLVEDCNGNVITTSLDETIKLSIDIFNTKNKKYTNLYFMQK